MVWGLKPYGIGAFGIPDVDTAGLVRSDVSSSRKIDGGTKRYVTNAQGGFAPMDDVGQRVMLAIAFADLDTQIIDERGMNEQKARIAAALLPETKGPDPRIVVESITVTRTASGSLSREVTYRKADADTSQTVKA